MKLSFAKKILTLSCCILLKTAMAQPGTTIDLEKQKPEKYKEKLLKSEKTPENKIKPIKNFMGNLITHYNYFFNANNKVNEVLEKAKESFVDDYSKLLAFYNYSLNTTAKDKNIDSVIYKCNAGILLHDLRTDWVDDMYMLLGKAYLYRKDFDSAYNVFQYLNYIYAPKDDGYDIPIGSNSSNEDGLFTISTDERKRSLIQKVILRKPLERNATFIWLVRNYLEAGKLGQASALISILQTDPIFPKRLQTDLNEVTAYYYYLQKQYDSSAIHLEKSLGNALNRAEKSRWEFLCGQMYQLAGRYDDANRIFVKSIKHTTNPTQEVYAHLNMIGQYSDDKKSKAPAGDIDALNKLANKKRFVTYKDIIYYAAGKVSLQQGGKDSKKQAADYFLKSATTSVDNPSQKSKSFLALADTKYDLKEYKLAANYYDSVNLKLIDSIDAIRVTSRKPSLKIVTKNIDAVYLQDSLQALAKLTAKDLNEVLKKIYKKYKKEKGLKDDASDAFDFGSDNPATSNNTPSFSTTDAKPGEFYFANESVKAQGLKDFKSKWGNRPNIDNWNKAAVVAGKFDTDKQSNDDKNLADKQKKAKKIVDSKQTDLQDANDIDAMDLGNPDVVETKQKTRGIQPKVGDGNSDKEITAESLYDAIPLTKEKITASNNIIIDALFQNGETFSNKLDDYPSAIEAYEELLRRFPKNKHAEQALFNLSYCYKVTNKTDKQQALQEKLDLDFNNGDLSKVIKNKSANSQKDAATKQYSDIYNMFLEGKYTEAKTAKREADSIYQKKYWNPQLSFIESV